MSLVNIRPGLSERTVLGNDEETHYRSEINLSKRVTGEDFGKCKNGL